MIPRSLPRLALALFSAGVLSAQATVFKSTTGGTGNVWVYPGQGLGSTRPPELQGIVLLPVDAAGRSDFTQFQEGQVRLRNDVPAATRLVLPRGQGSLYRYHKPSTSEFGYFVVRPSGLGWFLAAFPGTGPTGAGDPTPNPVAISDNGDAMLVATTLAAGGDLFEIELTTGEVHPLTNGLGPLDVKSQGLALLPDWGVALTSRGPLRFLRGSRPLLVPLFSKTWVGSLGQGQGTGSPTLAHYGNGIAKSADGSTVAVIAGPTPATAHVFTFRLGGPAIPVNDAPAAIVDPGFGTQNGPMLALAPDGNRAAWKTIDPFSGECFSRRVPFQQTAPEIQLTADQNFNDTLNDTGVIAFFGRDKVAMLVGEENGAGGVERADLFLATFTSTGNTPVFTNLTNTSGDVVAPFTSKGDIETSDGFYQIPGQTGIVYFVPYSSGQGKVCRLNTVTGAVQVLRSGIDQLNFIERAGSSFVLGLLHDEPFQRELVRIPFDLVQPATSLGIFGGLETFASHTGNSAGIFAGVLNVTGGQRLLKIAVPKGTSSVLPGTFPFGPTLGFDGAGAVLAAPRNATNTYFVSWAAGAFGAYGVGSTQSFVLPAN